MGNRAQAIHNMPGKKRFGICRLARHQIEAGVRKVQHGQVIQQFLDLHLAWLQPETRCLFNDA